MTENDEEVSKKKVSATTEEIESKSPSELEAQPQDVCKTPSPGGPIPIPYPNIAKSSDTSDGTKKVKTDGNMASVKDSNFVASTGDEAGTDETGLSAVDSKPKTIMDTVKEHPLLIVIIIVIILLVILVCILSIPPRTIVPYEEPEHCIRPYLAQIINA